MCLRVIVCLHCVPARQSWRTRERGDSPHRGSSVEGSGGHFAGDSDDEEYGSESDDDGYDNDVEHVVAQSKWIMCIMTLQNKFHEV